MAPGPASPLALRVRRPLAEGFYLAEVTGEVSGMDHDALVRVLDLPAPAPVSSANAPPAGATQEAYGQLCLHPRAC